MTKFRTQFTEFEDVEDAKLTRQMTVADALRPSTDLGFLYLTAHLLAIDTDRDNDIALPDGGSGEVTREESGNVHMSYRTQARNNAEVFYTRTEYGRTMMAIEGKNYVLSANVYGRS